MTSVQMTLGSMRTELAIEGVLTFIARIIALRREIVGCLEGAPVRSAGLAPVIAFLQRVRATGLGRTPSGYFYPEISPQTGARGRLVRIDGLTDLLSTIYSERKMPHTGGGKTGGARRGVMTDNQLEAIVRCTDPNNLDQRRMSAFTISTLYALRDLGLTPVDAQTPVMSPHLHIATALDLVCIDKMGRITVVELKTGFNNNYSKTTAALMRAPAGAVADTDLTSLPDTWENRHQLQALAQRALIRDGYRGVETYHGVLVVDCEHVSRWYGLEQRDHITRLENVLVQILKSCDRARITPESVRRAGRQFGAEVRAAAQAKMAAAAAVAAEESSEHVMERG